MVGLTQLLHRNKIEQSKWHIAPVVKCVNMFFVMIVVTIACLCCYNKKEVLANIFVNQGENAVSLLAGLVSHISPPSDMVYIPAGWFWMGCAPKDKQCDNDEKPYHRVYLSAYYIDKNDVTADAYAQCVNSGACTVSDTRSGCNYGVKGKGDNPINCVTWDQANTYCLWVGKRLPTEAEWEKAARGTDGRIYPWGNTWDCKKCCNSVKPCKHETTCPVGSYSKYTSPYGVMDMIGNVANWTRDWYDEHYYEKSPYKNPQGPESGKEFVVRGGSWSVCVTNNLRTSNRNGVIPLRSSRGIGFRCARSVF
jgi:formylglycine-generating enzyme required for sulfatase activity